jgi:hypothetical protein
MSTLNPDPWVAIEQLKAVLSECVADLESELEARYAGTLHYPGMKRKYDRDMQLVVRARELLLPRASGQPAPPSNGTDR